MRSYIGIPYKHLGRDRRGIDCYGLVVLLYREKLGVELYDPDIDYTQGKDACNYLLAFEGPNSYIIEDIYKLWKPVTDLEKYDVLLFNTCSDTPGPTHSGVYIGEGKFIHCTRHFPVTIHRMALWSEKFHSAYRYKERALND